MKINNDSADYYSEDLRMHVASRNTARELNGKREKEGKKESVRVKQSLRVACS